MIVLLFLQVEDQVVEGCTRLSTARFINDEGELLDDLRSLNCTDFGLRTQRRILERGRVITVDVRE